MIRKFSLIALILIAFLLSFPIIAQTKITGRVYNSKDSTEVYGASVYFDGTSIGTSTGKKGTFYLNLDSKIQANLIISSIGFEPIKLSNASNYSGKSLVIYLQENKESLETVYLEADPWTREKKMRIFKTQFLGHGKSAEKCTILNKEDIKLKYSPSENTLYASAEKPIEILNNDLGYTIRYNLVDFIAKFMINDDEINRLVSVYYAGTSFFQDLKEDIPNRILRKRKQAYLGSSLHFMRALGNNTLKEEGFQLIKNHQKISSPEIFELKSANNYIQVKPLVEYVSVKFKHRYLSAIIFEEEFIIDNFGNFSPTTSIIFKGHISSSRISKMVPLNYDLNI